VIEVGGYGSEREFAYQRHFADVLETGEGFAVVGLVLLAALDGVDGQEAIELGAELEHVVELIDGFDAGGQVLIGTEGFVIYQLAMWCGGKAAGLHHGGGVVLGEILR